MKGARSNFTPWLRDFEHQGENFLGGCCNPLWRTRVKQISFIISSHLKDLISKRCLSF